MDEETVEIPISDETYKVLEQKADERGISIQEYLERLLQIDKRQGLEQAPN
jgi:predicted CopG family antitoxin